MQISIELVPRSHEDLQAELDTVRQLLPSVNTINIPDVVRLKMRSWQACQLAQLQPFHTIPHIRAVDFDLHAPLPFVPVLQGANVTSVLVVTGDTAKSELRPVYPYTSLDLIKRLRQQHPDWRIYGAIDPYRQSFQQEYRYAMQKIEAGVDGFFTQPFFDLRLMEVYAELLGSQTEIYWGVSPVLTQRSQDYWETVNHAFFPQHFEPTLAWNRQFARDTLAFARDRNQHIYYMPIKVNLREYLEGIL